MSHKKICFALIKTSKIQFFQPQDSCDECFNTNCTYCLHSALEICQESIYFHCISGLLSRFDQRHFSISHAAAHEDRKFLLHSSDIDKSSGRVSGRFLCQQSGIQ